jgi:histone H3/H4
LLTYRAIATVQKIITEILPPSSGQTFSKDARDLLMECCVEFITLISSEANDISEKEAKKTIACEHVEKALRDLGFSDYIADVLAVAEEHKQQLKVCCPGQVSSEHMSRVLIAFPCSHERRSRAKWNKAD